MQNVKRKLALIKCVMDEIQSEDDLTTCFIQGGADYEFIASEFYPEQVYFNLIKHIIDCSNIPENVYAIQIYVGKENNVLRCEFISFPVQVLNDKMHFEIIFE